MELSERKEDMPELEIGELLKLAVENKEIISLGPGEPDFPTSKKIVDATKKFASVCNHYSPPGGRAELKEEIIKKLWKKNKIKAKPEEIIVTSGSQEGLLLAAATLLDVSEQAILPNPGFFGYGPTFELISATPYYVPVRMKNNFEYDFRELEKSINKKTRVIMINSPSNPTGAVWRKSTLKKIAKLAKKHDLYVFSDEAYEDIVYDNEKHFSIASLPGMKERTISFFSFSKSHAMCGYRLGYVVGPRKIIDAMKNIHIFSTISAPTISQMVGTEALKSGNQHTKFMVKEYDKRRKMMVSRLKKMGFKVREPKGAFYVFPDITPFSRDSKKFSMELLKKAKVAVVPGIDFGSEGEGFVRISYATDYHLIKKAMDRIENYLKSRN